MGDAVTRQEYGIPMIWDVTADSYERAAEHLARVFAGDGGLLPSVRHLDQDGCNVESWWFPEGRLKHIDGNDNDDYALVRQGEASPLPRDEDGEVIVSAEFGEHYAVEVEYNTDFDGRRIDPGKEDHPRTLHGPFTTQEEADKWAESYGPDSTDIHEVRVVPLNRVRPAL
jgi:hypothetical protein